VVWWRSQANTAASARRSTGKRFVRATVPLPTGVDEKAVLDARAAFLDSLYYDGKNMPAS
jgi:hypothetical protein